MQTGVVDRLATDFTEFHANVSRVIGAGTTVVRPRTYVGSTSAGGALDAIVAHVYDFEKDKAVRFPQCSATRQWHRVLKVDASDSSNPSLQSVDHPR